MPSLACVGYCGGHHNTTEMRYTNDGPMCFECFRKHRGIGDE